LDTKKRKRKRKRKKKKKKRERERGKTKWFDYSVTVRVSSILAINHPALSMYQS